MRSLTASTLAATLLCGTMTLTVAAQKDDPTKSKPTTNAVEKVRQELGKKITLDFNSQEFQDGIDHLRTKTGLNITLDRPVAMMLNIGLGFNNQGSPVHLKSDNGSVRVALQRMLNPYGLTYVILNDGILITTEQMAYTRQMQQGVSVDVDGKMLAAALKDLARETGVNLLIDPESKKKAMSTPVTLKLEDTTLETAARLLTEMAGLKVVQVGNVMFLTDPMKAAGIRQENLEKQRNNNQFPGVFQGGVGGGFGGFGRGGLGPIVVPPQNPQPPKEAPPKKNASVVPQR